MFWAFFVDIRFYMGTSLVYFFVAKINVLVKTISMLDFFNDVNNIILMLPAANKFHFEID